MVPFYQTVFYAAKDSGIKSLQDLKGRKNTFEDAGSTSGYLIPSTILSRQGFKLVPQSISFEEFKVADNSFDVVIMNQIVEHVLDINKWISKSQKLLKPNGVLTVTLPSFNNLFRCLLGTNEPYIIPPEYLNYFNGRNLRKLMSNMV